MVNWELWVTGSVVLFAIIVIAYLDWTTKHPDYFINGIPFPIRLLCILFGLILGIFGFLGFVFTGGISLGFILLAIFLLVIAFKKVDRKSTQSTIQFSSTTQSNNLSYSQSPVIQGLDESNEIFSSGKLFKKLLLKAYFRIPFMLLCFGLFLLGAFYLFLYPSILEKYGLFIILILALGYVGFRIFSIKHLINTVDKIKDRK